MWLQRAECGGLAARRRGGAVDKPGTDAENAALFTWTRRNPNRAASSAVKAREARSHGTPVAGLLFRDTLPWNPGQATELIMQAPWRFPVPFASSQAQDPKPGSACVSPGFFYSFIHFRIVFRRYCSAVSPPRLTVSSSSVNTGEPPRCRWIVTHLVGVLAAISRASFTRSLIAL